MPETWQANFFKSTELFRAIIPALDILPYKQNHWPGLPEFQQLLSSQKNSIVNGQEIPIQFIEQSTKCDIFEEQYEPRIFLSGEVQTRLNNWHDFFQVLVWNTFPKTKALLNTLHYQASTQRLEHDNNNHRRTKVENFLTLFDECGIIIVSTDKKILDLVRNFQWQKLFWSNRAKFNEEIMGFTFGHAMYEKALTPYIGMTANALLIPVDNDFFKLDYTEMLLTIDDICATTLIAETSLSPQNLNPFPILGVPDWHKDNSSLEFYLNESYFRKGRKRKETTKKEK